MASDKVAKFTTENWQKDVLESDRPVLVDFWAPWCGPCRLLSPIIDRLADHFDGKVTVGKLNVDDAQDIAVRYGISGIPQVMVFKGGEVRQKVVGLTTEADLTKLVNSVLES